MALSPFASLLAALSQGSPLAASRVSRSTREKLRPLIESGAIVWERSGAGRRLVVVDGEAVRRFMLVHFPSGPEGISEELAPKARAVANFRSAHRGKADESVVLVRAFAQVRLESGTAVLQAAELTRIAGVAAFVLSERRWWSAAGSFGLIENLELFLEAGPAAFGETVDGYLYYGGRMPKRVRAWLASEQLSGCSYLHLPDYDPVGLESYLRLAAACPARVRLFVPSGFEELVRRYGNAELLGKSPDTWRRVRSSEEPVVRGVVDVLHRWNRGLEQEGLRIERHLRASDGGTRDVSGVRQIR